MDNKKAEKSPVLYKKLGMTQAKRLANDLVKFVKQNGLSANIAGKDYLQVEAWQFIGTQMGLTDVVISCEPVAPFEDSAEIKYKSVVEIINQNGTVISRGFAWCSNKESKKKSFDEFAVASMSQTRAVGKAYRNFLAWIVKMAGYEAMPAEEADKDKLEQDLAKAKRNVLKTFNDNGITDSSAMMDRIDKVLDKRTIDNIDEAHKVMESFHE